MVLHAHAHKCVHVGSVHHHSAGSTTRATTQSWNFPWAPPKRAMLAFWFGALATLQSPALQPLTPLSDDGLNLTQSCRGCLDKNCERAVFPRTGACLGCSRNFCASPFCAPQERQGFCGLATAVGDDAVGPEARAARAQWAAQRAANATKQNAWQVLGKAAVMAALDGLKTRNVTSQQRVYPERLLGNRRRWIREKYFGTQRRQ